MASRSFEFLNVVVQRKELIIVRSWVGMRRLNTGDITYRLIDNRGKITCFDGWMNKRSPPVFSRKTL